MKFFSNNIVSKTNSKLFYAKKFQAPSKCLLQLRKFSMHRFLTHDAIAQGIFNRDCCTAGATMTAWQEQLVNTTDVLKLMCQRMDQEFNNTPLRFRKPWNYTQLVTYASQ